ncbi:MAG: sugar ABC transporter permease [Clostridia bacterium]|nr:sugar ABC transporter permease [Clostridia bacterium]
MKRPFSYKLNIFLFLLPALILFIGVLIAPIILSGYYSLTKWNGLTTPEYIGLANYTELFTSKSINIMRALKNAMLLAILSTLIQLPFALWLALKLSRKPRGERAFLSIYFMPVLISTVVIGQLWLKIYNPDYGVLNLSLRALGLDKLTRIWLGDKKTALWAAFVPILWQYVGYHMLLMYAGIKGVPPELNEAAMLDGCTEGQVNRYIIIPYIRPILRVSVIFAVTGSLKSFDLIYVLTNGGPVHATEVPSTLMISMLFLRNRYGMGSTIAVMLIVLCFFFAILINMVFKEDKGR